LKPPLVKRAFTKPQRLLAAVLLGAAGIGADAYAEPYLAVRTGFKCVMCHVNPSGGGLRNTFGTAWARSEMPRRVVGAEPSDADDAAWTGELNRWLAVGGNLRSRLDHVDTPGRDEEAEFGVSRATVYGALRAIPGLLTVYVDGQIAPGGVITRETYALLTPASGRFTVKAGKFFLPYGLRLEDDSAFIRQVTGVNFDTPDHGVELGLELPRWTAQLAVTNGTAGGGDDDTPKQTSLNAAFVSRLWRVGASYNHNNSAFGDREMMGVYAGVRTGPIAWLAEIDTITDDVPSGQRELYVSLLEGNWQLARGHNLKLSYEYFDPADDVDEDERERYSLVWEATPMQMLQTRFGLRIYNGVPEAPATERNELFAELHVFF
jgi:hypothetical protein